MVEVISTREGCFWVAVQS